MKVPRNSSIFGGFPLDQKFESQLPSGEFFKAGQIDSFFSNLAAGDASMLVLRQAQNFANIAKHSFGSTAVNQGILASQHRALATLFDSHLTLSDVRVALQTAQQIVGGLANLGESIKGLGAAVPVAGIIINLAVGVAEWIQMIIASTKAAPPTGQPALAYDRANDSEITQAILEEGKHTDWTPIFLPTRLGPWDWRPARFAPTGAPDGVFIDQGNWTGRNLGWGVPPLLTSQLGPYQYPTTLPGSKRPAGHESITGYTELHPSAVQAGLLYSQRIMAMSPEMFWIDPFEITDTWAEYFAGARDLAQRSSDPQLRLQLKYIYSFTNTSGWRRYGKWSASNVPDRFLRDHGEGWFGMEGLVDFIVMETWWSRVMATLGTPIVAYINPRAKALLASPRLAELHRERRILLLRHPRRWDVELDAIPDPEYRSAMYEAQMKRGEAGGLRLRTDPKPEAVVPIIASFTPDALPPPPDSDAEPAIPASLSPRNEGSGALFALALGGALVAALAAKR